MSQIPPMWRPTVFPGLGLDVVAALFALAGIVLAVSLWPKHPSYESVDTADTVPAFMLLGIFLVAAAVCEVGANIVRAIERGRASS